VCPLFGWGCHLVSQYTEELKELIVAEYVGGKTLKQIAESVAVSYSTLLRWSKQHDVFRRELQAARETRALHFEEEALEAAVGAHTKDDVPAARLKFDAFTWAAEKSDPAKYGKRTTLTGDASNPIQFLVQTGVPDPAKHQLPPELNQDGTVKQIIDVISEASE
jgi:transposase-like protein